MAMSGVPFLFFWGLFVLFLLLGFLVYEKTGLRLGGILVLPLLVIYALIDLKILFVFGLAAAASFWSGHVVYRRTLLYGRRLLYVFLITGVLATAAFHRMVPTDFGVFILAILPGLFAYNLHREGRYIEGFAAFAFWLGVLLVASAAGIWFLLRPDDGLPAVAFVTSAIVSMLGFSTLATPWMAWVSSVDWSSWLLPGALGMPEGPFLTASGGVAFVNEHVPGDVGE